MIFGQQSGRTKKVACTFSQRPGNPNHPPPGALGPLVRYRGVRAQHFFQLAQRKGYPTMQESKIVATKRLQAEGHWNDRHANHSPRLVRVMPMTGDVHFWPVDWPTLPCANAVSLRNSFSVRQSGSGSSLKTPSKTCAGKDKPIQQGNTLLHAMRRNGLLTHAQTHSGG